MDAIHQIYEQEMLCNWIGDGKRCVAFHGAGHTIAAWPIRLDTQAIAITDESDYVADEHVHEAQRLGVVKHDIIHNHDFRCLWKSESGVVGHDGKVTPFIRYYAEGIKRDATKAAFVAPAGPVSEALYENNEIFNKKYSPPHRYDMANVNDTLDLICTTDKQINRRLMLSKPVEKIKFLMTQYWSGVGKTAYLFEWDNTVNRRNVSPLIGLNVINRVTPLLLAG